MKKSTCFFSLVLCGTLYAQDVLLPPALPPLPAEPALSSTETVLKESSTDTASDSNKQVSSDLQENATLSSHGNEVTAQDIASDSLSDSDEVDSEKNERVPTEETPKINAFLEEEQVEEPQTLKSFSLTIQLPENSLIKKFTNQYSSEYGKKWLQGVVDRGAQYIPYILQKIEEMQLPTELVFLPIIESSYLVTARSSSNALGLWQFMTNSISHFGIKKNDWVDERLDPWKSTDAALKKLQENYNALGSWEMALAAYNCGLGAATRASKKHNSKDYWKLSEKKALPSQTISYVPKFLAISAILSEEGSPAKIDLSKPVESTSIISTKKGVDVKILAKEVGLQDSSIKKLNPALLYDITPPGSLYDLRVPLEKEVEIRKVLDSNKILISYSQYKVCSGDTLYALSKHYGVSIDMILQYNPGVKASSLRIGQKLIIPALKKVEPYKNTKFENTGDFTESYTIKKGDTLWSISLEFGVQVETLAEKNNMQVNQVLSIGKTLKVPKINYDEVTNKN